jgi:hypothetical protein
LDRERQAVQQNGAPFGDKAKDLIHQYRARAKSRFSQKLDFIVSQAIREITYSIVAQLSTR